MLEKVKEKMFDAIILLVVIMDLIIGIRTLIKACQFIQVQQETFDYIKNSNSPIVIGSTTDDVLVIGSPEKLTIKQKTHGTTDKSRK